MHPELPNHLRANPLPINDAEIEAAYLYFLRTYRDRGVVKKSLADNDDAELKISRLRGARKTLLHSARSAAEKLGCDHSNWLRLEKAEEEGKISLSSLRSAAEAIGCELVYDIKPKDGREFSRVVFDFVLESVIDHGYLRNCVANMRSNALANMVSRQLDDAKYLKKKGLARKRT